MYGESFGNARGGMLLGRKVIGERLLRGEHWLGKV